MFKRLKILEAQADYNTKNVKDIRIELCIQDKMIQQIQKHIKYLQKLIESQPLIKRYQKTLDLMEKGSHTKDV